MAQVSGGLVSGTVVGAAGRPVAGARLSWAAAPLAQPDLALLSDAQGHFVLHAPVVGRYVLRCDATTQRADGTAGEQHVVMTLEATGRPQTVRIVLAL